MIPCDILYAYLAVLPSRQCGAQTLTRPMMVFSKLIWIKLDSAVVGYQTHGMAINCLSLSSVGSHGRYSRPVHLVPGTSNIELHARRIVRPPNRACQ